MKSRGLVFEAEFSAGLTPVGLPNMTRYGGLGTLVGAAAWVRNSFGVWVLSLSGVNGDNASLDTVPLPTKAISVEAWCFCTNHKIWNMFVTHKHWGTLGGWSLMSGDAGQMVWSITTNPGVANTDANDPDVYLINTWVHFIGTYDGANSRLYRNGVVKTTTALAAFTLDGTPEIDIGSNNTLTNVVPGYVSPPRIYDYALAAGEVLKRYEQTRRWFGL